MVGLTDDRWLVVVTFLIVASFTLGISVLKR